MKWGDKIQKKDTLSKCINRINKQLGIRPEEKITGAMVRKTFVTLGQDFFYFPKQLQMDVTHHKKIDNFPDFVCKYRIGRRP